MGNSGSSSKSTTNQTYNTTYVNQSDISLLNSSVNSFIADTVSKQAKNCSSSISQIQNVNIKDITTTKDLIIGSVDQTQTSAMTFDCIQIDTFKNDIANGILAEYMNTLENSFSTDILDKLESNAKNSSSNNFGSTGSSSSKTNTNQNYTFNSTNTTRTNIENVIKNSIQNNVSMESVQNCISEIKNNQTIDIQNLNIGGNVKIGVLSQNQGATLMTQCMQSTDNGNKITTQIASDLGVTVDNSNKQTKTTTMEAISETLSANKGVGDAASETIGAVGDAAGSILSGVGGLFSGLGAGSETFSIICCCCLFCLLIIGLLAGGVYISQGGTLPGTDNMEGGFNANVNSNLVGIAKALKNLK